MRVGSRPDNAGTGQDHQAARVRQAIREGVGEEPVCEAPSSVDQLKSGGYGLECSAFPLLGEVLGNGKLLVGSCSARREATAKVCGVAVAMLRG